MNTIRLVRGSPSFHGRPGIPSNIECTPCPHLVHVRDTDESTWCIWLATTDELSKRKPSAEQVHKLHANNGMPGTIQSTT